MKRDWRLGLAIALLAIAAIASLIQMWIAALFVDAVVLGHQDQFAEYFGVKDPASIEGRVCFDYCAPEMPFTAGWIALGTFVIGFVTLIFAWLKPQEQ